MPALRCPCRSRTLLAAVVLAVSAAACASAPGPRVLTLPEPGVRPVGRIDRISDYRAAVATIDHTIQSELGEEPFPVAFRFFRDRDAFEIELLRLGYTVTLAHDAAATMAAIGGPRTVLLNDAVLSSLPWPDRVAILSHELAHTIQYELGGGSRGVSDQWVREGFAEWLTMRVLARLGALSVDAFRRQKTDDVRMRNRSDTPGLTDLATFPEWIALTGRGTALYSYAFVAVDLLIARHGVPAMLGYFQRFAAKQDRVGNFEQAFGETLPAFEATFAETIAGLAGS